MDEELLLEEVSSYYYLLGQIKSNRNTFKEKLDQRRAFPEGFFSAVRRDKNRGFFRSGV